MKRFATALIFAACVATAFAVPAKRQTVILTRPDGTKVEAVLMGDEHFHYYQSTTSDEKFYINETGECISMSKNMFAEGITWAEKRNSTAQMHRLAPRKTRSNSELAPTTDRTPFDLHGKHKGLVILVEYPDRPFKYTHENLDQQLNEVGYSQRGHIGSVHDYFYSQSYGQFDLEFDVVGPVQVSKKYSYYGKDNGHPGDDMYVGTMVAEACELAYADGEGVNFADYDWDDDGEAEMVVCIYAGYGQAQGAPSNTVWPQQWFLSEAKEYDDGPGALDFGGTIVDCYLVLNELAGASGTKLDGIGTFCHEYSHSLGLPDLYNTVGGSTFGMGDWNLMDSGCYNGDSAVPCAYTAYERTFCGWLEPTVLSEGCEVTDMKSITDAPEAYIIYNEAHTDEYFMLQNIQQNGWNECAPGHGMLVIHVDYDKDVWDNNVVNNTASRRRCTIVPADNNNYSTAAGLAGDPYPGSKKKTELTDISIPAATLYNVNTNGTKFLGKPITEIEENFTDDKYNGTISFVFNGGTPETPVDPPVDPDIQDGLSNITKDEITTHGIFDLFGQSKHNISKNELYISQGKVYIKK